MRIQIAGPGCKKCNQCEEVVKQAVQELGVAAEVTHVTDYREIAQLGVRIPPAILIDEKIVLSGRVPTLEEAKKLIT